MLFGAHGRIGAPLTEDDLKLISRARLECVKIENCEQDETIQQLRGLNPEIFIMARLTTDFSGNPVTADDFVRKVEADVGRFYRQGVQYFEVHANPNLQSAGWRRSWMNGRDFGGWFLRVTDQLRHSFPDIKIGFPGLSPGDEISGRRENSDQFMHEAEDAMDSADWIGVHCYWTGMSGMYAKQGKGRVMAYRKAFPHKLLFVTEFNNPSIAGKAEIKAQQYLAFKRQINSVQGVGAIFSYALSSDDGNATFIWSSENGNIADILGKRED